MWPPPNISYCTLILILHIFSKFGMKPFLSQMFTVITPVLSDFTLLLLGCSAPKFWEILFILQGQCDFLWEASLTCRLGGLSLSCSNVNSSWNALNVLSSNYLSKGLPPPQKLCVLQSQEFSEAVWWLYQLVLKLNYFGSNLVSTTIPSSYLTLGQFNLCLNLPIGELYLLYNCCEG